MPDQNEDKEATTQELRGKLDAVIAFQTATASQAANSWSAYISSALGLRKDFPASKEDLEKEHLRV
jgi:hypothetical protein